MMFGWLRSLGHKAASSLSLVSPWLRGIVWSLSLHFLALAREAYGQNSVVYACLRVLCQAVAEPPLVAYTVDQDGTEKKVKADHPLQRLIRRPNPNSTEYELKELLTMHMGIAGKAFIWKQRSNDGTVIALWPLRPDRVQPQYAAAGASGVLDGWLYLKPGTQVPVPVELGDIIDFTLPHPAGETGGLVEGIGPIQVLAREIEADNEATAHVAALLKNSATPGSILKIKSQVANRDQAKLIKQSFMAEFGGVKRGEPAIIDADTDYQQLGFNLKDLEFPVLRDVSEARIAAAIGVPGILVGLRVGIQSGIRATIGEQRKYFAQTTCRAYWQRLDDAFTNGLAVEFGADLICKHDMRQVGALIEQSRYEVEPYAKGFEDGVVTVDEYRDKVLNLPPLPDGAGKVVYIPTSVLAVPEGQVGKAGDATAQVNRNPVAADLLTLDESGAAGKQPKQPATAAQNPPGRTDAAKVSGHLRGATHASTHHEAARKAHEARIEAHLSRTTDRVASVLQRQAGDVARRIEQQGASKTITVPDDALTTPEERDALEAALRELWTEVLGDAGRDASDLLGVGISFDLSHGHIKEVLDQLADRVTGIDETTRAAIRSAIDAANVEGLSLAELAAKIDGLGTFGAGRAMTIARTELATASNLGSLLSYRQSGMVESVEVMDGLHDGPCASANGETWTLDEAQSRPLEHPNCIRCFAPIVKTADQQEAA